MFLKRNTLLDKGAVAGALLALSLVSTAALPVSAVAEEPATTSPERQPKRDQSIGALPNLAQPDSPTSATANGSALGPKMTLSAFAIPETSLKAFQFNQPSPLEPFDPGRRFYQTDSGQPPEQQPQGVNKRYLVLGIIGLVDLAAGVIAVSQTNKYCVTNNISSTTGQGQTTCNSFPTAGKVLIPVGAVVAGLGFYLAFRHRH